MGKNKKRPKGKLWSTIIQLAIGLIIGIAGGIYLVEKFDRGELAPAQLAAFALLIFIAFFININIHEFGHYIFGKTLGYRLLSYRISIFSWNNENSKMTFSIIRNKGYGGLCAMLPPEQRLPNYQYALFFAGGLILNLHIGVLFMLLPLILSLPTLLANLATITGATALLLALLNFTPFSSGNNPTDGKILWSLFFKKPFARKLMEQHELVSQLSAGIRPRDIKMPQPPSGDNLELIDLALVLYLYFKAVDTPSPDEEISSLAGVLESNLAAFPAHILPPIYYELCYVNCIMNNPEKARDCYHKAGKILQADKDINGLRVKAYYEYFVNNNPQAAFSLCQQGLSVADKFPIKGQGVMEKELLLLLLNRQDNLLTQQSI